MKPDSPVVITATLPKANGAEPETGLCRRAEYWQDRYHDLEASFYQVKAELTSVLERERSRLQKEVAVIAPWPEINFVLHDYCWKNEKTQCRICEGN